MPAIAALRRPLDDMVELPMSPNTAKLSVFEFARECWTEGLVDDVPWYDPGVVGEPGMIGGARWLTESV